MHRSRRLTCTLACLAFPACANPAAPAVLRDASLGAATDDAGASVDAASADAGSLEPDGALESADAGDASPPGEPGVALRIATYNLEDVRSDELASGDDTRLAGIAATLQRVRPDVLFVNELAFDAAGDNAQRFADAYLAISQGDGLAPLHYAAVMRPSNTGLPSGLDLDNARGVVGTPGPGYGEDCWGYGDFPGQYALAVLVRSDLVVRADAIRTFQHFKWSALPGAKRPHSPSGESWYSDAEWAALRLSSKTHMDVPVELPDGSLLHLLASHPTPPAFDGAEDRNGARNHDEIRFWAEYIADADFLVDDDGVQGGLPEGARFVIAGDLNADPDEGDSLGDPIGRWLLDNPAVNATFTPRVSAESDASFGRATDDDDTASFGLRVDYVLPSADLTITDGAVERVRASSDHALVWLDVRG
jgi:hypothetical protein